MPLGFRLLPWEYGVRNLFRRPVQRADVGGLVLVTLLIFIVIGFIRGLETSLSVSGEPDVVLVHARDLQKTSRIRQWPVRPLH